MVTIKGVFENGEIKMLESAPVTSSQKVLITFMEDEQEDIRLISLHQQTKEFEEYISNEDEDLYQDYLKK